MLRQFLVYKHKASKIFATSGYPLFFCLHVVTIFRSLVDTKNCNNILRIKVDSNTPNIPWRKKFSPNTFYLVFFHSNFLRNSFKQKNGTDVLELNGKILLILLIHVKLTWNNYITPLMENPSFAHIGKTRFGARKCMTCTKEQPDRKLPHTFKNTCPSWREI